MWPHELIDFLIQHFAAGGNVSGFNDLLEQVYSQFGPEAQDVLRKVPVTTGATLPPGVSAAYVHNPAEILLGSVPSDWSLTHEAAHAALAPLEQGSLYGSEIANAADPTVVRMLIEAGKTGLQVRGFSEGVNPNTVEKILSSPEVSLATKQRMLADAYTTGAKPFLAEVASQAEALNQLPADVRDAVYNVHLKYPTLKGHEVVAYAEKGIGEAARRLHTGFGEVEDIGTAAGRALDAIINPVTKGAGAAADVPLALMDLLAHYSPEYRQQVLGGHGSVGEAIGAAGHGTVQDIGDALKELFRGFKGYQPAKAEPPHISI